MISAHKPTRPIRRSKLPVSLRTPKDERSYQRTKRQQPKRDLTVEKPIKTWKHWYMLPNKFPYSSAFSRHDMLLPKRVISRKQMNKQENDELAEILDELEPRYDVVMMNFRSKQSVKDHFHIHLLVYKTKRRKLKI
jgi:diadenosine tetraphosphate (Ap4A) HIT family hydrolase